MSECKTIDILIPEEKFEEFNSNLEQIRKRLKVESQSEAILWLVRNFEELHFKSQTYRKIMKKIKAAEAERKAKFGDEATIEFI